mgnify:CR=1 FL=1
MSDALDDYPRIADRMLRHLLSKAESDPGSYQNYIESVVQARAHMIQARDLLHNVGVHYPGDGCEFGVDCFTQKDGSILTCKNYGRCKPAHDTYIDLLGGWRLSHLSILPGIGGDAVGTPSD